MHIRKVCIHGFKSFCDKTTLTFESGLSGVVGPNGCGKSNVFDAVKWCLGEQSAKSLRGTAMSDIIFNGSTGTSPSATAEVAITFARGEEAFPPPYHICEEIEIARLLHRSGVSEYSINKVKVRLKDIQDLFLDTGLHNRLYSFIEQGQIGLIVNARPSQTRLLFEEAAGISRFKLRKEQSLEKLKKVSDQLSEIDVMLGVLKKQLDSLARQMEQAAKYKILRIEEKMLSLYLLLAQGSQKSEKLRSLSVEYDEMSALVQEEDLKNTRQEAFLHQARVGHSALFQRLSDIRNRLAKAEKDWSEVQLRLQLAETERAEKKKKLAQIKKNLVEEKDILVREESAFKQVSEERLQLWSAIQGDKTQIIELQNAIKQLKTDISKRFQQLEQKKKEQKDIVQDLTNLGTQVHSISLLLTRMHTEQEDREKEQRNWNEEYGKIESERAKLLVHKDQIIAQKEIERAKIRAILEEIHKTNTEKTQKVLLLRQKEKEIQQQQKQQDTLRTEIETLKRMQKDNVGFSQTTKNLLKREDVLCSLLSSLHVPEEYQDILAVALGERIETLFLKEEADTQAILRQSKGRVHLVFPFMLPEVEREGLLSVIQASEEGYKALGALLGPHSLYQNWKDMPQEIHKTSFCVHPPFVRTIYGGISAGIPESDSLVVLERSRALLEKNTLFDDGQKILSVLLKEKEDINKEITSVDLLLDEKRKEQHENEQILLKYDKQLVQVETEFQSLLKEEIAMKKRQDKLLMDTNRVVKEIEMQEQKRASLQRKKGELEKESIFVEEAIRVVQVDLQEEQRIQRDKISEVQQRESDFRLIQEKVSSKEQLEIRLRTTVNKLIKDIDDKERELQELTQRIQVIQTEIQRDQDREVLLSESCKVLGEKSVSLEYTYTKNQEDFARLEKEFREQISILEKKKGALARKGDEREQRSKELDSIAASLREIFSLDLGSELELLMRDKQRKYEVEEDVITFYQEDIMSSKKYAENKIEQKNRLDQLSSMHGVNHMAIEQHAVQEKEYSEKKIQREDIAHSVSSLEEFIAELDQRCIARFEETYNNVNTYFQALYPQLVGGGHSYLELEEPSDLLNTGVRIFARPPGKRLQPLSLLSGGEKAMVAISLLFSLFKEKPSPFCLLDEVDAPLDEGNAARFNGMLKEMSLTSQFIVITHNKKTMEAMDLLYGVSMPKPGISQVGSVRLR